MTTEPETGTNVSPEENKKLETGTSVSEPDTTEVETDIVSDEEIDNEALKKKKNAEKAKKMLAERNELRSRISLLEETNALNELKIKFWEFDVEKVKELKQKHPTLSYEDAFNLAWWGQKPNNQNSFAWIVWTEKRDVDTWSITMKELTSKSADEYKILRAKIDKWELIIKG